MVDLYKGGNAIRPTSTPENYLLSINVTFNVWTGNEWYPGGRRDPEGTINTDQKTYIITHGFQNSGGNINNEFLPVDWMRNMANAIKVREPGANIILVDWEKGSTPTGNPLGLFTSSPYYGLSAAYPNVVGDEIAEYILKMGYNPSQTTLIGHSLGAQASGDAGEWYRAISGQKIGQIIALDAAAPDFEGKPNSEIVDASDANNVIGIHTSLGKPSELETALLPGFGFVRPFAHQDLYIDPVRTPSTDLVKYDHPGLSFNAIGDHGYAYEILTRLIKGERITDPNIVDPSSTKKELTWDSLIRDQSYSFSSLSPTSKTWDFQQNKHTVDLSSKTIYKNSGTETPIGKFSVAKIPGIENYNFSLNDDAGGRFRIVGDQLFANSNLLLDQAGSSYSIDVKTTGQFLLSTVDYDKSESFSIELKDVNESNQNNSGGSGGSNNSDGSSLLPSPSSDCVAGHFPNYYYINSPYCPKPVEPTPVNQTPVEPTSQPTPVNPTPVNSTPVNLTPVEPTPVNPTPVNLTPVNSTPVNLTPVEPTPVNQTSQPTPVNPTPVNPTPVVDAKISQLTQPADNLLQIQGGTEKSLLKFTKIAQETVGKNEVVAFVVDDAQGRIGGIAPGSAGYLAATLDRSQVIFSNLGNNPKDNEFDRDSQRYLNFATGERVQFALIADDTLDTIKTNLATGKSTDKVLFSLPEANPGNANQAKFTVIPNNGGYEIAWEDNLNEGKGTGNTDFNDLVLKVETLDNFTAPIGTGLQGKSEGELLDFRSFAGQNLKVDTVSVSDAGYQNYIGFYAVEDAQGTLANGLKVGDIGYAEAAIKSAILRGAKTETQSDLTVSGGKIFAPVVIANGTFEDFLTRNPQNQANGNIHAYFNYLGANTDKVDHFRLLGDNKFGVEDMYGGGDRDYNDIVIQMNVKS